jgi:hypothetical protein
VTVGFHSLRHTFVSLCRAAGTPLSVVEAIVGHSSPAMTQHYTHTGEVAARAAIALLPGLGEPEVSGQKSEVSGGKAEASGQKALVYVESATPAAMARAALTCLEAMTVKNWEAKRDEALKALRGATEWLEGRMVVQEK